MKPTRILLADSGGALGDSVLGLPQVLRNMSPGPCTVRNAAPAETLSGWNPDLVLMDLSPVQEPGTAPIGPEEPAGQNRQVVVLTLCYEEDPVVVTAGARGRLTSATVQLIDLPERGDGTPEAVPSARLRRTVPDRRLPQREVSLENPAGAAGSPRWLMWKPAPLWRVRVGPRSPGEAWRLRLASDKNTKHESE